MKKIVESDRNVVLPEGTRVLFVLPRMVAGGVERATLNLIDGLKQHDVHCHLALGRCYGELLDEACALVDIDEVACYSKWFFPFGLMRVIKRYRPTHVITAFADVTWMVLIARSLAGRGSRVPVIMGIHGTLQDVAGGGALRIRLRHEINKYLGVWIYPRCAAIVAVSHGVAADVREVSPPSGGRLTVIHNPVYTDALRQRAIASLSKTHATPPFRLVALGRLSFEKGFDVLIRAMPVVISIHDAYLDIYGEGVERHLLQALIEELHMEDRILLRGNTLDPLDAISGGDVFVFPSRNEGFGVALVEALSCGKQIVASDCPHGPAEILSHGLFGQLVEPESPEALAHAISLSLSGKVRFDPDALRARAESYSADAAVTNYVTLLQQVAHPTS
jgi:glycosyltransferase involved in cell wall biosynthesis